MRYAHACLVAGVVMVAACGSVTDAGDPGRAEEVLSMPGATQPLELTAGAPRETAEGEDVPMTLSLRNTGGTPVKVEIGQIVANGQAEGAFNFFVLVGDEDVVRQRKTVFADVGPATHTLRPNDTLEFEWTWDQRDQDGEPVGPGTYQVVGILSVDAGAIRSEPASVTIR